ncbi:hypothetical protein ANAEL_03569 [Anaerolineales bacterium]|nr:hypothetical protein ANAEL_03569 [Anaerolineales bacterium]
MKWEYPPEVRKIWCESAMQTTMRKPCHVVVVTRLESDFNLPLVQEDNLLKASVRMSSGITAVAYIVLNYAPSHRAYQVGLFRQAGFNISSFSTMEEANEWLAVQPHRLGCPFANSLSELHPRTIAPTTPK